MPSTDFCVFNARYVTLTLTWPIEKAIDVNVAHAIGYFISSVSRGYEAAYLKSKIPALSMYDIGSTIDDTVEYDSTKGTAVNQITLWVPSWRKKAVKHLLNSMKESFCSDYDWSVEEGITFSSNESTLDHNAAKKRGGK